MNNICADINFIIKQKEKPYYDSSAITGLIPKLYFKVERKNICIYNARNLSNLSIDRNGFELHRFENKYDTDNIQNNLDSFKKDLKTFLKRKICYKEIFLFDITRRSNKKEGAFNIEGRRPPADRAHVDYTAKSGPIRAKNIIGEKYFYSLLEKKRRIIQLNVWKPLCDIVLSSPLAFVDSRTILNRDLIATEQRFPDRIGEIYHLAYNKKQDWFWVPEMTKTEVLFLKGWDSSSSKKIVKFTPHTSFDLPKQNKNKFPRESIEVRIFLVI